MLSEQARRFIDRYAEELMESSAAVFVGAGFSRASGYVNWKELMTPIAEELGLDIEKVADYVQLAQYYINASDGNRSRLSRILVDRFMDLKAPSRNHLLLSRLPIKTYWTTNYDRMIENTLEDSGKRIDVVYEAGQLTRSRRGRDAVVYKMHGDILHSEQAVLCKEDYEQYPQTHSQFIAALSNDLVKKTFVFLGFSFSDPNLYSILSQIKSIFHRNQRRHYALIKKIKQDEYRDNSEYVFDDIKQNLLIRDLTRFNIETVLYDEHEDVYAILKEIHGKLRRRTLFVSGSAGCYDPWGQERTERFVSRLVSALIDRDFRIASGFGTGMGATVVGSAVQQIYSTKHRSIEEQLLLRPFPVGIADRAERERTYARYREELVAQAGVAIFVMGNRLEDGRPVVSEGVLEEFELARRLGLHLVPVGASGWAAADLWREVNGNLGFYFGKRSGEVAELMAALGRPVDDPLELMEPLLALVGILSREEGGVTGGSSCRETPESSSAS